jgi:hypothetical protein
MEKSLDQMMVNIVLVNRKLKTMQNWIQADTPIDGIIGLFFELIEQRLLVEGMEGINDLIGKTDETIYIIYRFPKVFVQQTDGR